MPLNLSRIKDTVPPKICLEGPWIFSNFHHWFVSMSGVYPENFSCIALSNQFLLQLEGFDGGYKFFLMMELEGYASLFLIECNIYPENSPQIILKIMKIKSQSLRILNIIPLKTLQNIKVSVSGRHFENF